MMGEMNRNESERAEGASRFAGIAGKIDRGFYVPLVRKLMEERETAKDGAAFVFTAVGPGEGVSVVTGTVARELASESGEKVLIAEANSIGNFVPAQSSEFREPVMREGSGIYRLRPATSFNSASRAQRFDLLKQLKLLFAFVLIDCPALSVSTEALEFGARSQGLVLVAAAGQVRRSRLLQAKRIIEVSGVPLLGCALNRRTYPIPEFLYRRL